MPSPRWSYQAIRRARSERDQKRAREVVTGPIADYLRHHLDVVERELRRGETYEAVTHILADAHPGLTTHDKRPIGGRAKELKKAVRREREYRKKLKEELKDRERYGRRPNARRPPPAVIVPSLGEEPVLKPELLERARWISPRIGQRDGFEDPEKERLAEEIRRRRRGSTG